MCLPRSATPGEKYGIRKREIHICGKYNPYRIKDSKERCSGDNPGSQIPNCPESISDQSLCNCLRKGKSILCENSTTSYIYLGGENKVKGPDQVSDRSSWKAANHRVVTDACENPANSAEHNWIEDGEHFFQFDEC